MKNQLSGGKRQSLFNSCCYAVSNWKIHFSQFYVCDEIGINPWWDEKVEVVMGKGKSFGGFFVIFLLIVLSAGCSSSGDDNGTNHSTTDNQTYYTSPGSDLVLQIPDTLEVSQEEIEDIHYHADQVPHCYTTNRESIDIALAEACVYYDLFYLFPQYFPRNLNNILNVKTYVEYMGSYDPFTYYFSPDDYIDVMSLINGNTSFIGFTVECDGQTVTNQTPLVIKDIDPFTRAWIDGFMIGDKLIKIDGISIEEMNLDAVSVLFPKNEEEDVEITIERDGVEMTIHTAAEENIGLLLYQDIVYLNARAFTEATGEEIRLDYEELQIEAGGMVGKLILDLRGNGGGDIWGSLRLIDYLINKDNGSYPILSISGPAFEDETEFLGDYNVFNIGNFDRTNFVLLIDENTASASEIVAAALKHYGIATLIGNTTYGKGIGQSMVKLIDGSGVVIPSVNILPPSGESYHGIGIHPDCYLNAQVSSFDDDPVLDAAVIYLKNGDISCSASNESEREERIHLSEKIIAPHLKKFLKEINGDYF